MMKKLLPLLALLVVPSLQATPELDALLETLKANGTITEEQFQRLSDTPTMTPAVPPKKSAGSDLKISIDNGLKLASADGQFALALGGRVETHAAWYDDDGSDMGDGLTMRRMRLYLKGHLYENWLFKLDYDFAPDSRKGMKDAYIAYRWDNGTEVYAGNYRVPFSLEFQANSHATTFMERALPFAFAPGWRLGGAVRIEGEQWLLETGLFGDKPDAQHPAEDGEWLAAARLSWTPYREDRSFLHIGAGSIYSNGGDNLALRYQSTPESRVTKVKLVDTGQITGVDQYQLHGLEAALTRGRFNAQAEYMSVAVDREPEALAFDGWYIQSSLFLTDDSRRYKLGRYLPVNPSRRLGDGGTGAWELALRLSSIDLDDADIRGNTLKNLSLGLNLYATRHIRFSAEYISVLETSAEPEIKPSLFQLRAEWVF